MQLERSLAAPGAFSIKRETGLLTESQVWQAAAEEIFYPVNQATKLLKIPLILELAGAHIKLLLACTVTGQSSPCPVACSCCHSDSPVCSSPTQQCIVSLSPLQDALQAMANVGPWVPAGKRNTRSFADLVGREEAPGKDGCARCKLPIEAKGEWQERHEGEHFADLLCGTEKEQKPGPQRLCADLGHVVRLPAMPRTPEELMACATGVPCVHPGLWRACKADDHKQPPACWDHDCWCHRKTAVHSRPRLL